MPTADQPSLLPDDAPTAEPRFRFSGAGTCVRITTDATDATLSAKAFATLLYRGLEALRESGALTPRGRALTGVAQQEILRGEWF